ncbi:uncharacterized protein [Apostichopus japonicus]|uniref:uncharacterized protein isoform X1 n=1 Tax=Stichopus japonicus TaxID=307972 RepID=UPI003AB67D63
MAQPQFQQNSPSGWNQQQYNNSSLKGSTVRVITGGAIIVMGVFEIIWAIVLLSVPLDYYFCIVEHIGGGIWGGVFAIVTGSFGIASRRHKCMVIVYMILAIIASVIAGGGLISSAFGARCVGSSKYYYYYDDENVHQSNTHLAFYILLSVTFAIQSLAAIIGASFTCVAVCPGSNNQPQQMITYQPTQLPYQRMNSQAPYPAVITTNGQPTPHTSNIQGVPPSYNYAANNQHVVNVN